MMTEQEYINVRDLSNVMHVVEILKGTCIANQPAISKDDYETVVRKLYEWNDVLFAQIKTDTNSK